MREFAQRAFAHVGFDIAWKGVGVDEIGFDKNSGRELIFIDPIYFRPAEVDLLIGDSTKARNVLGWQPRTTFHELVEQLVDAELDAMQRKITDI